MSRQTGGYCIDLEKSSAVLGLSGTMVSRSTWIWPLIHRGYLDVSLHVALDRLESYGAEHICHKLSVTPGNTWLVLRVQIILNKVVRESAASRNSFVPMALSLPASTGTSLKDLVKVSRKVPPVGYGLSWVAMLVDSAIEAWRRKGEVGRRWRSRLEQQQQNARQTSTRG